MNRRALFGFLGVSPVAVAAIAAGPAVVAADDEWTPALPASEATLIKHKGQVLAHAVPRELLERVK